MATSELTFDPQWHAIADYGAALEDDLVSSVNAILFGANPAPEELGRIDVCLVLGSRACGYKALRALELFGADDAVTYVVCGANTTNAGMIEADMLADILTGAGISPHRILVEAESRNTVENLQFARRLLLEHGIEPAAQGLAIVSSGFHRVRVLRHLPPDFSHAKYISAAGAFVGQDTWHTNQYGRETVLGELRRLTQTLLPSP